MLVFGDYLKKKLKKKANTKIDWVALLVTDQLELGRVLHQYLGGLTTLFRKHMVKQQWKVEKLWREISSLQGIKANCLAYKWGFYDGDGLQNKIVQAFEACISL